MDHCIQFPPNFVFSEDNFICFYSPNNDMPIMPMYSSMQSRRQSFQKLENHSEEEINELAHTGFYFSGVQQTYLNGLEEETFDLAVCFFCGCGVPIYAAYPRKTPVRHFLHCGFFILPEDKKHIKENLKPIEEVTVTWDMVNSLRKKLYPGKVFPKADLSKPPLKPRMCKCKKNEIEVWIYPCHHFSCISCAKRSNTCCICGELYSSLRRSNMALGLS